MTIYLDVHFLLNLIWALLILVCMKILYNIKSSWYRLLLASALCALYSVIEIIFGVFMPLRLLILYVMTVISWGFSGGFYNYLRLLFVNALTGAVFIGVVAILGINSVVSGKGITVIAPDFPTAVAGILIYLLIISCNALKKRWKNLVKVRLWIKGNMLSGRFLYDSGNLLKFKGVSVAVTDWNVLKHAMGEISYDELVCECDDRVIYNTVDGSGILPLIKPEKAVINGICREIYIGAVNRRFIGYWGVIGDLD